MLKMFQFDSFEEFMIYFQGFDPSIKLILYLVILVLIIVIVKKIKIAGKIMNYVMGLTIGMQLVSMAGFEVGFIDKWLDIFRYILMFWGFN